MKPTRLAEIGRPDRRRAFRYAVPLAAATIVLSADASRAAALVATGSNPYGQIGNGTVSSPDGTNSPTSPVSVDGMNFGVTAMAAGGAHSLGVKGGALYGWGFTNYGALGNGVSGNGPPSDPYIRTPTPQPALVLTSGVTAVQASLYSSFAIANGAMYSWGLNSDGILSNGTASNNFTATPTLVTGLGSGPVTAIAAGSRHVVAVQNGALYAWGYTAYGQIGNGVSATAANTRPPAATTPYQVPGFGSGVTRVAAGGLHTLAVRDNALFAWGSNQYGQLGLGNGSVTGVDTYDAFYNTPQAVNGLPAGTIADVSAGNSFSMALVDGKVYTWGRNESGQLGNGGFSRSSVPGAVTGITGTIVDVEAGSSAGYALDDDGSLWAWGSNTYGQLGLGSTDTPFETPQHVSAPAGYRFSGLAGGSTANHVLITQSALPVYFTGATGNSLNDVANFAANLAGTTPAPIATVESTDVFFAASTATPARLAGATVASAMNANSLTFGTGGSAGRAVTVGGPGTITLYADKNTYAAGTGVVVQSGAGAVTINAPVAVAASQTWTNGSASALTVAGGVSLGANTLTVGGTGPTNLTGPLSGTGSLVKTGTGTLRATSPTYTALLGGTGGLDVQAGRVVLDPADAASPLAQVKAILTAGYQQPTKFATGQIRGTTLAAGRTLGYGGDGTGRVTLLVTLPGDADLNGSVNFADFVALQSNFGASGVTFAQGDFDYNNVVNFADFVALQSNFGQGLGRPDASITRDQVAAVTAFGLANAVPEPASLALASAVVGLSLRRTRRTRRSA